MDVFDWVGEKLREYRDKGDRERFDLARVRTRHYGLRDTNVDAYLQALRDAATQARLLEEPYWALYYDTFFLEGMLHDKKDCREALDMAARCVLEVRKPMYRSWPGRFVICNIALLAYIGVDPWGYSKAIQELLDALDKEVPPEPNHDRMVATLQRCTFLMELERWDEARQLCIDLYPHAEEFGSEGYLSSIMLHLCFIEYFRGNWEGIFAYPDILETISKEGHDHKMQLAESLAWRAALARHRGNEEMALRRYRSAEVRLSRLTAPPTSGYFQAVVAYHEQGADWEQALAARDRELAIVAHTGQFHYECLIRTERCRILQKLGRPIGDAIAQTREAASRLREPGYILAKLDPANR
ncbi:MAG: hypothetical protein K2X38_01330 [Gemmataceae bacterium]|nr:hypothetical protein [Gemmataceae bacterium]